MKGIENKLKIAKILSKHWGNPKGGFKNMIKLNIMVRLESKLKKRIVLDILVKTF